MRIIYICLITSLFFQLSFAQKNGNSNDSIIMRDGARIADSIFLLMNGGDTNKLNHMSKTVWIYDGQGNVIGGSKMKKGTQTSVKLIDSLTSNYYILDSTHIFVTAYDKSNKIIWKTDPYIDNAIEEYRTIRPIIINWGFGKSPNYFPKEIKEGLKVIWITYNNTQYGFIDIRTGKYYWCGQD
jgi:hypothetical protein